MNKEFIMWPFTKLWTYSSQQTIDRFQEELSKPYRLGDILPDPTPKAWSQTDRMMAVVFKDVQESAKAIAYPAFEQNDPGKRLRHVAQHINDQKIMSTAIAGADGLLIAMLQTNTEGAKAVLNSLQAFALTVDNGASSLAQHLGEIVENYGTQIGHQLGPCLNNFGNKLVEYYSGNPEKLMDLAASTISDAASLLLHEEVGYDLVKHLASNSPEYAGIAVEAFEPMSGIISAGYDEVVESFSMAVENVSWEDAILPEFSIPVITTASSALREYKLVLAGKQRYLKGIKNVLIDVTSVGCGASGGALIGSCIFPVVGTAIGGFFGSIGGKWLGKDIRHGAYNTAVNKLNSKCKEAQQRFNTKARSLEEAVCDVCHEQAALLRDLARHSTLLTSPLYTKIALEACMHIRQGLHKAKSVLALKPSIVALHSSTDDKLKSSVERHYGSTEFDTEYRSQIHHVTTYLDELLVYVESLEISSMSGEDILDNLAEIRVPMICVRPILKLWNLASMHTTYEQRMIAGRVALVKLLYAQQSDSARKVLEVFTQSHKQLVSECMPLLEEVKQLERIALSEQNKLIS